MTSLFFFLSSSNSIYSSLSLSKAALRSASSLSALLLFNSL